MSRSGHHKPHWLTPPSFDYLNDLIGKKNKCPKRSCRGILVEVWSRYKVNGPINIEHECTECGKVTHDSRYKKIKSDKNWKPNLGVNNENRRRLS